ncbi:MAG: helix-turn-helix transcriptional regulator [Chloroflexi bacterium]|nr:helix-turn-helix transcriptional regulator [Chloroflexota bacterium]
MRRREVVDQLVQLRRRRGLSQAQLEEMAGVSQQQISKIELGMANPRLDTLLALALALKARIAIVAEEATLPASPEPMVEAARVTGVDALIVPDEDTRA